MTYGNYVLVVHCVQLAIKVLYPEVYLDVIYAIEMLLII